MGRRKQSGFTIIETVLFLAVSVGLFAVLIAGITGGVIHERYKDSIQSFMGIVRQQYALTSTVKNDRSEDWVCGQSLKSATSVGTLPGTSDCVILGRFIQLRDGVHVTAGNLIGYNIDEQRLTQAKSDIEALTQTMSLTTIEEVSGSEHDEDVSVDIDWGSVARIVDARGDNIGDGARFTMAIIRAPLSGEMMTFIVGDVTNDWKNKVISSEAYHQRLTACILPSMPVMVPHTAVIIPGGAIGAQGISQSTEVPRC